MSGPPVFSREWIHHRYLEHFRNLPASGRQGWRFLYCPEERLSQAAVGIIGLNPGGRQFTDAGEWDYREGRLAHTDEPWADGKLNPLQQQVVAMLDTMGWLPDEVVGAQIVPFRSASWAELIERDKAIETFAPLRAEMLRRTSVRLWISLGHLAGRKMAETASADLISRWPTGWGQTVGETYTNGLVTVIALPHLSRFRLFNRASSGRLLRPAAAEAIWWALGTP